MKNTSQWLSFKYAFSGIVEACRRERHLRFHFFAALCVVGAAAFFRISAMEWMAVLIVIALVISAELINSALEALVDRVSPQINPLAKYVKDVAAGAVLVMAIVSVVIGLIVFLPKIVVLF